MLNDSVWSEVLVLISRNNSWQFMRPISPAPWIIVVTDPQTTAVNLWLVAFRIHESCKWVNWVSWWIMLVGQLSQMMNQDHMTIVIFSPQTRRHSVINPQEKKEQKTSFASMPTLIWTLPVSCSYRFPHPWFVPTQATPFVSGVQNYWPPLIKMSANIYTSYIIYYIILD